LSFDGRSIVALRLGNVALRFLNGYFCKLEYSELADGEAETLHIFFHVLKSIKVFYNKSRYWMDLGCFKSFVEEVSAIMLLIVVWILLSNHLKRHAV
jgi:hypothetical protein